jgi:hypothetical protein
MDGVHYHTCEAQRCDVLGNEIHSPMSYGDTLVASGIEGR